MKTQILTLPLLAALAASLLMPHLTAAATVIWNGAGTNSVPATTNWSAGVN